MRKKNGNPGRNWNVKKENEKPGMVLVVYAMCMVLAGCVPFQPDSKIEIHPVVSKFLEGIHIEKSAILSLGDYSDISYHLETPEITEEEIDTYEKELTDAYGMEEITLDSIKDNFGLSSYDEFREFISEGELNHKKIMDTEQCREDVLGRLEEGAKFDMNQEEVKIGAKTFYDASGGRNGDKLKTNVYKRGLAQNTVVYKCGVTTYKTSSCVSSQRFTKTLNGVKFINLTKVNSAFCQGGDSGGIVYTYQDNEYWPCGIVKGHGGSGADGYAFFVKASEIANVLNVEPY